jgi:glycosyltransferase involved in cell wall biosynthesis
MGILRDKNVVLSVAGHGGREDRKGLEELAADLNLLSKVKWLSHVEDVATLYRQTDCTVSASVVHESFSQTLIEAMACGSPLITSDFGPFPEINDHQVTGVVVPTGDADSMAKAISRMMEDESSRIQMGRRARERAERLFSINRSLEVQKG